MTASAARCTRLHGRSIRTDLPRGFGSTRSGCRGSEGKVAASFRCARAIDRIWVLASTGILRPEAGCARIINQRPASNGAFQPGLGGARRVAKHARAPASLHRLGGHEMRPREHQQQGNRPQNHPTHRDLLGDGQEQKQRRQWHSSLQNHSYPVNMRHWAALLCSIGEVL